MTPFGDACVLNLDGSEYPREIANVVINILYSPGTGVVLPYWCSMDDFCVPYVPGEHRVSVSLKEQSGRVFTCSAEQLIQF